MTSRDFIVLIFWLIFDEKSEIFKIQSFYRGDQGMNEIFIMMESRYEFHIFQVGVTVWM